MPYLMSCSPGNSVEVVRRVETLSSQKGTSRGQNNGWVLGEDVPRSVVVCLGDMQRRGTVQEDGSGLSGIRQMING
jgi:hypothetical protein